MRVGAFCHSYSEVPLARSILFRKWNTTDYAPWKEGLEVGMRGLTINQVDTIAQKCTSRPAED